MSAKGTTPDIAAWAAAKKHRPNYAKNLAEYHATFDVKERGLKKWVVKARLDWINAGCPSGGPEFPPLDEPAKVLAWWLAHMTLTPSPKLYELAGVAAVTEPVEKPKADAPAAPVRVAIDVASFGAMDLAAAAEKQRQLLAATHSQILSAQANVNTPESTITMLSKRWDDTVERLRKIEDSLTKTEIERGDRPHLNDIRSELGQLLAHLAVSLIEMLVDRAGLSRVQARALADEWFGELRSSRFIPAAPVAA